MEDENFDRIKVKEHVIKQSNTKNQSIPLLSYSSFEVLSPEAEAYIDETLVQALDNQELEGGLTDELFFHCLDESPHYLAFEVFRNRVVEWQTVMSSEEASTQEKIKAQENLVAIGKRLGAEPKGRPLKFGNIDLLLRIEYSELLKKLEPFCSKTRTLSPHKRIAAFEEEFPPLAQYAPALGRHREAREMAKEILCQKHKISRRHLYSQLRPAKSIKRQP